MGMRILVELFWPQRRHLAHACGFLDRENLRFIPLQPLL